MWIDCEMTGLDLARDALIEIACLVTDGDLTVLDEGVDLVIKPPADDPDDLGAGVWAGVVPIAMTFGEPEPDAALRPGIAVPDHITGLGNGHRRSA